MPGMQSTESTRPAYRADIDGLRAVAVLSVVGFHAFPASITGGFIGVDVFFVISGFLISSLIFSSLARGTFSFGEFYSRRIRRIFPALLLILVAGALLGWFALPPDEYKQLGKHVAGGAGFVSNFVLWGESGYFDSAASTKPLLHLWSLGIEEQFYIAWPLFLWLVWRLRWNLLAITLVVGAVSFLLNVVVVGIDPIEAFYAPQCRIWELMAGSALAWVCLERPDAGRAAARDALAVTGAVLIGAGFVVITEESAFPGWWALLPMLGTLLIVAAGPRAWLNRVILSNRVLVWIGLISYPLYLWHWLLLSFARQITYAEVLPATRVALIGVSFALAWLTYRLIERPIRFGPRGTPKAVALAVLMAVVGSAGYCIYAQGGFPSRFKDREAYLEHFDNSPPEFRYLRKVLRIPETYRYECDFWDADRYFAGQQTRVPKPSIAGSCHERNPAFGKAVFIWGDSHAQALYSGLKNHLPPDWQILQVGTSGCIPAIDSIRPSKTEHCAHSNWFAVEAIGAAKPDVVLIAQNVGHDIETFGRIAARLKRLGVDRVILVGPSPHWVTDLPKIIANRLWLDTPRRTYVGIEHRTVERNAELARAFRKSDPDAFVDVMGLFCDGAGCLTYIGDDRKAGITTYDRSHLTPIASDYLAKGLLVERIVGATRSR